jgi:predicted ATP-grasp superfamily ATP-dependent carboligase
MALRTTVAPGMSALPTAIVLGVDTPIGVTVMRELGINGVPVHAIGRSSDSIGRASRYCTGFSVRPEGPLDEWLPDLIRSVGAAALLAVSEGDLVALSAMDEVVEGCQILTPRATPLAMVLDKRATLKAAAAMGMTVPISWQPVASDDRLLRARTLIYPVVVKWADPPLVADRLQSHGLPLIKAEFVHNVDALLAVLARYDPLGLWPLVQSYCPGNGLGQMLYMDGGQATLMFQHRRLHEWPPEGGVSTLCTAEPLALHADQMEMSEALLAAIGWQGPAMVEYRHDAETGSYALMEINGRFWGSLPLASHCGVLFAWESYRRNILKQSTPSAPAYPIRRARYMIPETRRLFTLLFRRGVIADPFFKARPTEALLSYLGGFFDPKMRYFLFRWRDPGPFLADMRSLLFKLVRRETPSPAPGSPSRSVSDRSAYNPDPAHKDRGDAASTASPTGQAKSGDSD